jgi:hypothetical protein
VKRIRIALLLALVACGGCCVSKVELTKDVQAWRSFYESVKPDLADYYSSRDDQGHYAGTSVLPAESQSTRMHSLADEDDAIAAAESRARSAK